MLKPRDIKDVFAANLAYLMQREASVSAFCRDIGINRTQFNRYLSGASSPRPEILARICAHFGVDARILLEPLEDLLAAQARARWADAFSEMVGQRSFDIGPDRLPLGFYSRYRNSIDHPGRVSHMLAHIGERNGVRVYRAYAKPENFTDPTLPKQDRLVSGVVLGAVDGFSMVTMLSRVHIFCHAVYEFQHRSSQGVYPGVSLFSRARHPQVRRLVKEALIHYQAEQGLPRQAAAHPAFCSLDEAPAQVREILTEPFDSLA